MPHTEKTTNQRYIIIHQTNADMSKHLKTGTLVQILLTIHIVHGLPDTTFISGIHGRTRRALVAAPVASDPAETRSFFVESSFSGGPFRQQQVCEFCTAIWATYYRSRSKASPTIMMKCRGEIDRSGECGG